MFERVTGVGDSLFDQFRRMESEMNQLFGTAPLPSSIRAVQVEPTLRSISAVQPNRWMYICLRPGLTPNPWISRFNKTCLPSQGSGN